MTANDLAYDAKMSGYQVSVIRDATKQQMLDTLSNREVQAVAFFAHDAFEGAIEPYGGNNDEASFLSPDEIARALGNRYLMWAGAFVCYSAKSPELKNALVGPKGAFIGQKGFYNPVLDLDSKNGMLGWFMGRLHGGD